MTTVNEAPSNEVQTVFDVTIHYPNYGDYHFKAIVGVFGTERIVHKETKKRYRYFITNKDMEFSDAPTLHRGSVIYLS